MTHSTLIGTAWERANATGVEIFPEEKVKDGNGAVLDIGHEVFVIDGAAVVKTAKPLGEVRRFVELDGDLRAEVRSEFCYYEDKDGHVYDYELVIPDYAENDTAESKCDENDPDDREEFHYIRPADLVRA